MNVVSVLYISLYRSYIKLDCVDNVIRLSTVAITTIYVGRRCGTRLGESFIVLQCGTTGRETNDDWPTTALYDWFGFNLARNAGTKQRRRNWSRRGSAEQVKSRDLGFEFQRGWWGECACG